VNGAKRRVAEAYPGAARGDLDAGERRADARAGPEDACAPMNAARGGVKPIREGPPRRMVLFGAQRSDEN
jgi:hypothetical protein